MILIKLFLMLVLGVLVFIVFLGAVLADQDRTPLLELNNDLWHI